MLELSAILIPVGLMVGLIVVIVLAGSRRGDHSPKTEIGINPTPIRPIKPASNGAERHPMAQLENVITNVRWPINN